MNRSTDDIHDEWLILRCQSGEAGALAELLQRWRDRLLDRARRLVRDEADAVDAHQEALIAAARTIHRLDDPARFGGWIHRILAHKCADAIRRRRREGRAADRLAARGSPAPEAATDDEDISRVRLAIERLPTESRALLIMRYARDMSTQQIAAAIGIREGTVKSRLHHVRNELKSILERDLP